MSQEDTIVVGGSQPVAKLCVFVLADPGDYDTVIAETLLYHVPEVQFSLFLEDSSHLRHISLVDCACLSWCLLLFVDDNRCYC